MTNLVRNLNLHAETIKVDIKTINKRCKKLEGKDVTVPKTADWPIKKFAGRKGRLYNPCFDSHNGCIHAVIELYYLDGSGRIVSYHDSRYYAKIDETWFQ